jgi:thymidylate synthase ThyX
VKVTQVGIRSTEASRQAGRPELTPELLAATGARYSRSDEGLDAILAKIDPENPEKSVDGIFKMIDYGHQSIADMAPVAMFIDGISIWLAYHVWSIVPTAGGQESSTRYIKLDMEGLLRPADLGLSPAQKPEWNWKMGKAFDAYQEALEFWEQAANDAPELMRIPQSLIDSTDEKDVKKVARLKRNYAFDRARYFLPVAAATNMMLVMSARGWVQLCQQLLSHPLPEAGALGAAIREGLELVAPRLIKHATHRESFVMGLRQEFDWVSAAAQKMQKDCAKLACDERCFPCLEVGEPPFAPREEFAASLQHRGNRYDYIGSTLQRTSVRFGWDAVAMAEIRDLNRHRTGTKYCPLMPIGFYCAQDQVPGFTDRIEKLGAVGVETSQRALDYLAQGDPTYIYWTLLGTQYRFEHLTTADKFIYEAELRTGLGAHYRYAQHLRDVLQLWYRRFPETKGLVLEGSAEPE